MAARPPSKGRAAKQQQQQKANKSLALGIAAIVVGMVCLAYASVPLYDLFCRVTGFGGTTQVAKEAPKKIYDREITIRFNADISPDLPWEFYPEQKQLKLRVGERKLAFFHAKNLTNEATKGTAIYNVTPNKAGIYFQKIQCFCFENQTLKPNESMEMPVSFFIDPAIMTDKKMDDITTITLSYTFFKVKDSS
jgi:cytochrome c oxidase assembly protein subunit 11